MTKEYLESILTEYGVAFTDSLADRLLKEFEPCEDVISRGALEQVRWERDTAIKQLNDLGYEFGEKIEPCEDAISRKQAICNNLKALEQSSYNSIKTELISRQVVIDGLASIAKAKAKSDAQKSLMGRVMFFVEQLPPVKPQYTEDEIQKMQDLEQAEIQKAYEIGKGERQIGHCKDCKYFEYDSVAKVDGIPLIVAHEICKRWGDGCKTKEDGYCFMFEPQESEE